MNLRYLFKPKWQHPRAEVRLAAMAKISSPKKLRKIAVHSKDERVRFEAARRLADISLISRLARTAAQDTVRLEAALLIRDQAILAAIALNDWDIERGQKAVRYIDNAMLLQRIARSAQQDGIRLAAAMKLQRTELIREVAETTNDIQIRWQVACHLEDPYLMAQIALYKPANIHMSKLRQKAFSAYKAQLDKCRVHGTRQILLAIMHTVDHTPLKLEAFIRLPVDTINDGLLKYLSRQEFRFTSNKCLLKMLKAIKTAGWQVSMSTSLSVCAECNGNAEIAIKSISVNSAWVDYDRYPCPECNGRGSIPLRIVTCKRDSGQKVIFQLPKYSDEHSG
jgi:hypothetical protein